MIEILSIAGVATMYCIIGIATGYVLRNKPRMCTDCGERPADPFKTVCWKCAYKYPWAYSG